MSAHRSRRTGPFVPMLNKLALAATALVAMLGYESDALATPAWHWSQPIKNVNGYCNGDGIITKVGYFGETTPSTGDNPHSAVAVLVKAGCGPVTVFPDFVLPPEVARDPAQAVECTRIPATGGMGQPVMNNANGACSSTPLMNPYGLQNLFGWSYLAPGEELQIYVPVAYIKQMTNGTFRATVQNNFSPLLPAIMFDVAYRARIQNLSSKNITSNSAQLTFDLHNYFSSGQLYVDFGKTSAFGLSTPAVSVPNTTRSVLGNSVSPTGLSPGTSYFWQARFERASGGTYTSVTNAFMTSGQGSSTGEPHISTVNGVNYDFQAAGEFVLLRDEFLEIQTRQTAVETDQPLSANAHTGLSSCVSLNSAVALRIGRHRITYQPNLSGRPDPEGLQLRIDGKLSSVGTQGIPLESGDRIIRTSAPGGIQIEGPDGAVIVITPNWWNDAQLWYMNVDVRQVRATRGLMGTIAEGDWLPVLPDGSSMGPKPRDVHQRYLDLYGRFADAWRVSDRTSLFDYSPGTSTTTFTINGWPSENPRTCIGPREGSLAKAHLKPLALEEAQRHCQTIVAANHKANCEQDVMLTGEIGFAKTYLLAEQITRNTPPTAPSLVFPENATINLAQPITFTWTSATDSDGDSITYRHCVWPASERPNNNTCDASQIRTISWSRGVGGALLVFLAGCSFIALLIHLGMRQRHALLKVVAVAVLALATLAFYICGIASVKTAFKTVAELQSGKTYAWKVIADDGKGGSTPSQARHFTTK